MGKVKQNIRQGYIEKIMSTMFKDVRPEDDDSVYDYQLSLEAMTLSELEKLASQCDESTSAEVPEFIRNIDFKQLREQKAMLLQIVEWDKIPQANDSIDGIVNLIDALQDYCTDEADYTVEEVFGDLTEDELVTEPVTKPTTKKFWICTHCGSDNVEFKRWINPNTNEVGVDCEEDGYCNDCEESDKLELVELKSDARIIGFQVIGIVDENEGVFHPNSKGYAYIYNLRQANTILAKQSHGWGLSAVWNGDVEDPIVMFTGGIRD